MQPNKNGTINFSNVQINPALPGPANNQYENIFFNHMRPRGGVLYSRRLSADRNIVPESKAEPNLDERGSGASNYLYHYMRRDSGNERLVQKEFIPALNEIFDPYTHFETIDVKELGSSGTYEIYVYEKDREPVKLSDSGSGFKTIFLILINLLLVPDYERKQPDKIAFCFEEIENNLHPGLQRKLIAFIKKYAREKGSHIFLTTHSSAILDSMQTEEDVQVIHVKHSGKSSKMSIATTRVHNNGVLDDLDVRASDILQANSIIWVEGPSDRIYIKRFIDIASKGKLVEGIHYQIVFYGGRLLSHLEAGGDGDAVDILKVNRHAIMVMDSDFSATSKRLTPGKRKMKAAMNSINGITWVTEGKEIENYLSGNLISKLAGKRGLRNIGKYTKIDLYLKSNRCSELLKDFKKSKAIFAEKVAPSIDSTDIKFRDLKEKIDLITKRIAHWNGVKLT